MANVPTRVRTFGRWAAFFSALFGLGHLAWAAGLRILGATDAQFALVGQGSAAHLLTEGAIGLAALAASFLTLALVEPWGAKLPRRLPFLTIGFGVPLSLIAGFYGLMGLVLMILQDLGRYRFIVGHDMTASIWWYYWYALFLATGLSFLVMIWVRWRRRGPPLK